MKVRTLITHLETGQPVSKDNKFLWQFEDGTIDYISEKEYENIVMERIRNAENLDEVKRIMTAFCQDIAEVEYEGFLSPH